MTPEQERAFRTDFKRCLPAILEGCDPALEYPDGWLNGKGGSLPGCLAMDCVLEAVAKVTKTTPHMLKGPRRSARVALPRTLAYLLMNELCPQESLVSIGGFLNKDHTTVLQGTRRARLLLERDEQFKKLYDAVMTELKR